MGTDFDKIASLVPVDQAARRVIGGGVQFKSCKKILTADQPYPLPTRAVSSINPFPPMDLTGRVSGRFTVIGLSRDRPKRWVVMCVCGIYSLRTAKSIKNKSDEDMCETCRELEYQKKVNSCHANIKKEGK